MLKVNEFTLAGAVLADSLGPGCGQKERAGSRLTPRLKARHFQTNTIARDMHNCSALCFGLLSTSGMLRGLTKAQSSRADTVRPGYTTPMQSTGDGESLPYSLCMKVSKFQLEDKSKTQRVHPCSAPIQTFSKIKKAWS